MLPFRGKRPSPEAGLVLAALREPEPAATPAVVAAAEQVQDWDQVVRLGARHSVSPWLLRALSGAAAKAIVPANVLAALRAEAKASALLALRLASPLEEALRALECAGVPTLLLKGPALAESYYPDPGLRPYSDIDLLVPLEAHVTVAEVCRDLGYVVAEDHGGPGAALTGTSEAPFETAYTNAASGGRLDIHHDHLQVGLRPRALAGVWARSRPWRTHDVDVRVLELNDLVLFLAVHLHRHGFGRLIWFKDLDLIIRQSGEDLDWTRMEAAAREEGVGPSLRSVLRLLIRLLETPVPPEAERLAQGARADVLHRLLWRDEAVLGLEATSGRWRRAVQFVPTDGLRGALPSLLLMGRRPEKLRALWRRTVRRGSRKERAGS